MAFGEKYLYLAGINKISFLDLYLIIIILLLLYKVGCGVDM